MFDRPALRTGLMRTSDLWHPASAVYVSTIKKFVTVRNPQDVSLLSPDMDAQTTLSEDLFSEPHPSATSTNDPTTIRGA